MNEITMAVRSRVASRIQELLDPGTLDKPAVYMALRRPECIREIELAALSVIGNLNPGDRPSDSEREVLSALHVNVRPGRRISRMGLVLARSRASTPAVDYDHYDAVLPE